MSKKIKSLKHRYKNGEFNHSETKIEVDNEEDMKDIFFLSAFANYLDSKGIKQEVTDYLDDALAGDKNKLRVVLPFATDFNDTYEKSELSKIGIREVTLIGLPDEN